MLCLDHLRGVLCLNHATRSGDTQATKGLFNCIMTTGLYVSCQLGQLLYINNNYVIRVIQCRIDDQEVGR